MKKNINIVCSCGTEYSFKGNIGNGCLFCFVCGKEIIKYDPFWESKILETLVLLGYR